MAWLPIEIAPKDRRILGWDGHEQVTVDYIDGCWVKVSDSGRGTSFHITRWMPLPQPPQIKGV
jgi:hypothetical protein